MDNILKLLENEARLSVETISERTEIPIKEVKLAIKKAEDDNVILKYKTIINWNKLGKEKVTALVEVKVSPEGDKGFDIMAERIFRFPEVRTVYMVSGNFDFAIIVACETMQEVARFVSEKLAPLDAIKGTVTHFVLKKYKEDGAIF